MSNATTTVEILGTSSGERGIAATLVTPPATGRLEIRAHGEVDLAAGDAVVCLALLPALSVSATALDMPVAVSERLLERARDLVEIFRRWIGLHGPATVVNAPSIERTPQQGLASFFSCGVDSFFTALKNANDVDTLLFLRGFDLPEVDPQFLDDAANAAAAAARALGIPLEVFDLSVRGFSDPVVSWEMYHGSVLAAVAHTAGRWGHVLVPATLDYRFQAPWGSHPWTDPLWSSEKVELEDDGVWASRLDKIAYIAEHEIAMQHLRVCWSATSGNLNCGRCRKCLETILALELVGARGRCATLPADVDVHAWEQLPPLSPDFARRAVRTTRVVGHLRDLLEAGAADHPAGPEVRRMLEPYDRADDAGDPFNIDKT